MRNPDHVASELDAVEQVDALRCSNLPAAADTGTAARALDPWNGAERAAAGASHARAHGWACAREGSGAAVA